LGRSFQEARSQGEVTTKAPGKNIPTFTAALCVLVAVVSTASVRENRVARVAIDDGRGVIAFSSARGGNRDVYVMDADGGNVRQITTRSEADGYPAWSPDGRKIAFYAYHGDTTWSIHVINADGSGHLRLTRDEGARDSAPAWSPDGRQIAYGSERDGVTNLWVMNADGSGRRRLGSALGGAPDWSPDGSRIVCHRLDGNDLEICVIDPDGRNIGVLTDNDAHDLHPAWSPDGSRIAFMSNRDGDLEIYVMDADGTHVTQLTHNDAEDWEPFWSPDGSKFVFSSRRDGNMEVYVMSADGSNQTRLTHNPTSDGQPTWLRLDRR
jgi:TolB protein